MTGFKMVAVAVCLFLGNATAEADERPDSYYTHLDDDRLTIEHFNAVHNCCQDELGHRVEWVGGDLHVTEFEDPPGGYCDCVCYFDLSVTVEDLPPGPLHVVYHYLDHLDEFDFVVEEAGQTGDWTLAASSHSDCHQEPTGVESTSWGMLRLRFR
mgnify:CR=1 FL=1